MTTAQQNSSTLLTVIDDMVRDKTFSLEAVQAIHMLRGKAADMEAKLKDALDDQNRLEERIRQYDHRHQTDLAELATLRQQYNALKTREAAMFELEKRVAVAEAVASTMRENMALIFKPLQIRRGIFEGIVGDGTYGPNGQQNRGHVLRHGEEESQE